MVLFFKIIASVLILGLFNLAKCENFRNSIPELNYLNTSVDPCENFYEFSCGNFENVKPRPEDMSFWDNFIILQNELHSLMKEILESRPNENDPVALQKSKAAYRGCVDVNYLDQLKLPEVSILGEVGDWPLISDTSSYSSIFSWNELGNAIAEYGLPMFFNIEVMPKLFDANTNIIYISKDQVLNPAIHPYFPENSVDFLNSGHSRSTMSTKHPFETFLYKIASSLRNAIGSWKSDEAIQLEIEQILDFMYVLQNGGIQENEYSGTYNEKSVEELQKWTDEEIGIEIKLNWLEFLNSIFRKSGVKVYNDTKVLITDMKSFYGVLNLIKQTDESMLKNFEVTRLFTYTAPDSTDDMRQAYDEFKIDMGDILYPRSDYCTRKVLDFPGMIGLSFALTYEYQQYYFDVNKIKMAAEMIDNLTGAFIQILNDSDWLDDETRQKAIKKVDKMITLLAYPDFIETPHLLDKYYENLRVCTWDHFGNSQRLRSFRLATNLALLGKPRDREVWQLSPLVVNAFYNAANNRILFPVAMLSSIFFTGKIKCLWKSALPHFSTKLREVNIYLSIPPKSTFCISKHLALYTAKSTTSCHHLSFKVNLDRRLVLRSGNVALKTSISALDYGRIGMVIGHEITHGFDNQGKYYDEDGSFTPGWWSKPSQIEYNKRQECFMDQYGKYYISEIDQYVNASNSIRENIADNGGLRESFKAFKNLQKLKKWEKIADYTPEQLFFIGFGTMWCTSQTNEYLAQKIQSSNYPPAKFRVIGSVSNNEEFAKAFNCPVGSNMNPERKCILW